MTPELFQQLIAEMIEANETALGIMISAISRQKVIDGEALFRDLLSQINAAMAKRESELAIRICTMALATLNADIHRRSAEE